MRFVILHYHVLKNAGTTVEGILARNFSQDYARLDASDPAGLLPNEDLLAFLKSRPEIAAVSSHQIRYPVPAAPGFVFFDVCFLRDPIDRIRSMYDFFREKPAPADPVSELANASGLGWFVARMVEEFPHFVNDAQVVTIANGSVYDHPPGEADLDRATATMLRSSLPGVVDRLEESLVAGQYFLGPVFPGLDCAAVPVNVSGRPGSTLGSRLREVRRACGAHLYSQLERLNQLDYKLLKRARSEVLRRYGLVPDREARLSLLRARIRTLVEHQAGHLNPALAQAE